MAGGFPYPAPSPYETDPRYQKFRVSTLQPGQREIIRCTEVSKIYGNTQALSPMNLVVGNGRVIGLLGPNGSGKTTLIKLICGLLTPTNGTITVNGVPIGAETKAMISYLPDRTYIPEWMKIKEILDYFSDFYVDFRRPLAETMLGNLRISPDAVMKTLSKGTQEKVQLVLVMSRNASLYLLDEPIAGVDPVARDYILNTIISAHNPDSSVIISTHLINDIEPVLNEVIMIRYGTLAIQGDANELRQTFGKSLNDIFKEVFAGC
ncbi:MAG: ABC transporter ATP-binding protein [Oscillospiraceae bacterium]|nr:ABC transporter ATP-binding protein [Oscillospiraceae bacterium]